MKPRTYMLRNYAECLDERSVVSCTKLAELTCESLDLYDDDGEVPDELFELAVQVSEVLEQRGDVTPDAVSYSAPEIFESLWHDPSETFAGFDY